MGYAKQGQNTKGIHIRQFSRAFIFEQDGERNVYVSADCGMMGQLVKMKVSDFNLFSKPTFEYVWTSCKICQFHNTNT